MHCSIEGCFPLPASSILFSFQQTIFYSMSFKRLLSIQCTLFNTILLNTLRYIYSFLQEKTLGDISFKLETKIMNFRPKIKFYLFGIATRPTEKLAAVV
jgi:hypothetical protein